MQCNLDYLDYVRCVPPTVLPTMQEMQVKNSFQELTEEECKYKYRISKERAQNVIRLLSKKINENDDLETGINRFETRCCWKRSIYKQVIYYNNRINGMQHWSLSGFGNMSGNEGSIH